MIERTVEVLMIDDDGLSREELASACAVSVEWIERHVRAGLLLVAETGTTRFTSVQLLRARRLAEIERTFEANDELAALVVDLIEEVERLRGRR
jgi:chaperone modulatory protein CbpM